MKRKIINNKSFVCKYCGIEFVFEQSRKNHIKNDCPRTPEAIRRFAQEKKQ